MGQTEGRTAALPKASTLMAIPVSKRIGQTLSSASYTVTAMASTKHSR